MSWDLVSETDSGYRKYRDSNKNLRYQKPNGQFTSQSAWAGTFSQGATEKPKTSRAESEGDREKVSPNVTKITLKQDVYDVADNWVINEPKEPPELPPYWVGGWKIQDYPVNQRITWLRNQTSKVSNEYDLFSWSVTTRMIDKDSGAVLTTGERHTTFQSGDAVAILEGEFRNKMEDLGALAADYGVIVIAETKVKSRIYEE